MLQVYRQVLLYVLEKNKLETLFTLLKCEWSILWIVWLPELVLKRFQKPLLFILMKTKDISERNLERSDASSDVEALVCESLPFPPL